MSQQTSSAVNPDDVNYWVTKFKSALNDSAVTAPAPASATPWYSSLFGCFDPIDTCLITCCCPCVTFGKTHHREQKDATMAGYEPVNPTCIGFCLGGYCGIPFCMALLTRSDMRKKYNLQGDCMTDCLKLCCCAVCTLVQTEKESEYRALNGNLVTQQVKNEGGMVYPPSATA